MRTFAMLGLLLLLVLAWTLWSRTDDQVAPEPAVAPTTEPGAATTPASVEAAAADAPAASVESTAARTEVPPPSSLPQGPEAVLRGRCVDEHGRPIAGVNARLTSFGANRARMDAWSKDHDEPKRIDSKVAGGDDGVFEFRFWPPPPFQFSLSLAKPGLATMSGRWSQLEPGAIKDLGDVRMPRGTLLRGRVVDSQGVPVASVDVHFGTSSRPSGELAPVSRDTVRCKADGTFEGRWSLLAGAYPVDVPHRTVVSPKSVAIGADQAEQSVEIVLEALDDSKAVAGIVVDELGKPVQGVTVRPSDFRGGWTISTDKEGRFRVPKTEGGADEVSLSLEHPNFERLAGTEKYRWGRTDIRLSLQRALDVQLSVVDADGAPVEAYQVRIFPHPATTGSISSLDYEVRGEGRHEGGRTQVKSIRRGRHCVLVQPAGDELAMSRFVPIEVADPGPSAVTVTLVRKARRDVRVHRSDGTPVAGAQVQLVDPFDELARVRTSLLPPGSPARPRVISRVDAWERWGMGGSAIELQAATTDAEGSALLLGPGDRALALVLPGPGHVPTFVEDVHMGVTEPLVVTVTLGAALSGTLRPLAAIAELRRGAGLPPTGPVDPRNQRLLPRIELEGFRDMPPTTPRSPLLPATVADDGTFAMTGLPGGTWRVQLSWWHETGQQLAQQREILGTVTLREGEQLPVDFDVAHLLPGVLDGVVLHNGSPLALTKVTVTIGRGTDAERREFGEQVTTDADGRFRLRTRAGECTVTLPRQQRGSWSQLRAPESIRVVTGQTVAQTFHVRSGTVRARLLDAQGRPVAQVPIELRAEPGQRQDLPATDADGWTTAELEVRAFTASVMPKNLQDPKAQMEFHRSHPDKADTFAAVRLQCGSVTVQAGATTEVELRLPVEWPR